jgi:hypothetical protein
MTSVSDRASPRWRHHGLPELHQELRLLADFEAEPQCLTLEAGGDRQHDVSEFCRRIYEEIGVDKEVQRRQRFPPLQRVREGEQEVRSETYQRAHRIGVTLQHRAVEVVRGDAVPLGWPERAGFDANGRRHPPRRRQVLSRQHRVRDGRQQDVAAALIKRTSEGVEQRHGARGLGGVGMMLVPAPGVVGDGPRVPDQPRCRLHLFGGEPAGLGHVLGGVEGAERGEMGEDRAAGHRPLSRQDCDLTLQRQPLGRGAVAAGGGVVGDRLSCHSVQGNEMVRRARLGEVGGAQQQVGVGSNKMRRVRPPQHEVAVVPAARNHHLGKP